MTAPQREEFNNSDYTNQIGIRGGRPRTAPYEPLPIEDIELPHIRSFERGYSSLPLHVIFVKCGPRYICSEISTTLFILFPRYTHHSILSSPSLSASHSEASVSMLDFRGPTSKWWLDGRCNVEWNERKGINSCSGEPKGKEPLYAKCMISKMRLSNLAVCSHAAT